MVEIQSKTPFGSPARSYPQIGVQIPKLYLPKPGIDLTKWAVVACDQFTSEPEYWQQVEEFVGDAPSTLRMILPEAYLGSPDENGRIKLIQETMRRYLELGILQPAEGMVYVEREIDGKVRKGLVLCLDLEHYDFNKGSSSLIRATEGTIIERLPPRMRIREAAPLELPHIIVLIDDPGQTVIEPLSDRKGRLSKQYDFDLMMGSGHLSGYLVQDDQLEAQVVAALIALASPVDFTQKYDLSSQMPVLLFAMGDGNHSLATAKAIWEKIKPSVGMEHPARYALVEIENVHDQALEFEPIHRVIFGLKNDLLGKLRDFYGEEYTYTSCPSSQAMIAEVDAAANSQDLIGIAFSGQFGLLQIKSRHSNLAVGKLQPFLDDLIKSAAAVKIDYLHGKDILLKLAAQTSNAGFYLPKMQKSDLFKTVILDGALPRKTFSMGEAKEKRFYMECRRIV